MPLALRITSQLFLCLCLSLERQGPGQEHLTRGAQVISLHPGSHRIGRIWPLTVCRGCWGPVGVPQTGKVFSCYIAKNPNSSIKGRLGFPSTLNQGVRFLSEGSQPNRTFHKEYDNPFCCFGKTFRAVQKLAGVGKAWCRAGIWESFYGSVV